MADKLWVDMRARLCRYWTGWQQPWRWLVNTGQYTTRTLEIRPEAQLCLYSSLFIVLILSTAAASQTFVRKQHYTIPTLLLYLLYMRMSGVQMVLGGNLRSFTLPYSVSFHRRLLSVHSWKLQHCKYWCNFSRVYFRLLPQCLSKYEPKPGFRL